MSQDSTQTNHLRPITVRKGLFVVLLASGFGILFSVNWIYYRILVRLGLEIAEVVVAFLTVLIVILILFGFWVGLRADRILRRHQIQAHWICQSLKRYRLMQSLWRYMEPSRQRHATSQSRIEMISIPENAPRRGRRPTHSLDRWIPVVHAWENRDTLRNDMTLSEFLGEQFGTYVDGSPKMSENSYYVWKKKVFSELQKQEHSK